MGDEVAKSFEIPSAEGKQRFNHPIAAIFHVFFRTSALLVYILLPIIFSGHFIEIFLTTILLLSVDFWTVKNVTGRLLVGLRWWNKVEEDGTSVWIFESRKKAANNGVEALFFWAGLFAFPVVWLFFLFTALVGVSLQWAVIPITALALTGANVVGYVKCRKDAGAKLSAMAGQFIGHQLLKQATQGN